MKGIVLNLLNEMVEEEFDLDFWDDLIEVTQPASKGIYTSVEIYPDSELSAYAAEIAKRTDTKIEVVVRLFGEYMLRRFASMHPEFFEGHTAKSFLMSVHDVIHVEVEKLHPGVILPNFTYEEPSDNELVMRYESPRKLCHLAEGLIAGSADYFKTTVTNRHDKCMHKGADHCVLHLSFSTT